MVGVPHSNGCHACVQRRVKCDQTRPECHRCLARARRCPGYRRLLRFYHSTPGADEFVDASARANSRRQDLRTTPTRAFRPTMDETVAPNLMFEALDLQLKDNFTNMVAATFPVTYAAFCRRVNPDWVTFIRHHSKAQPTAVTLSIRCLNTWYLAIRHQDAEKISASRHMYSRALRHLGGLLRSPGMAKADATLTCAVLLGVYEMWDGLDADSWLIHARGIKTLFQLRGPEAHLDGFGRTLFTTYRSFLVADAFLHDESCFLATPKWRQMTVEVITMEERDGKGSALGEAIENLFNEIIFLPGYYKRTRDLISQGGSDSSADVLISEMRRSQEILRLHRHKLPGVPRDPNPIQATEKSEAGEAPFPTEFVPPITRLSLEGADSALAMICQLLIVLEAHKSGVSGNSTVPGNPWKAVVTPAPKSAEGNDQGVDKPSDWLDHIAMTMGVLAITP